MMRGTFGNIRIKNKLVKGKEGNWTVYHPSGAETSIYDAAMDYKKENTPLLVFAGKEYGTGSSRDWAAKGTLLLGVRAVIAESYERIHRSNLIGMGVLPLQFGAGQNTESLGLDGTETYAIQGIATDLAPGCTVHVTAKKPNSGNTSFDVLVRLDTPIEVKYYRHGGILLYVLRDMTAS